MSKWSGDIGFESNQHEDPIGSGIFVSGIVDKHYKGDLTYESSKNLAGSGANDNLRLNQKLSIVADPYAYQNYTQIKYAKILSTRWKVESVELARPRLYLTLGGIWNGPTDTEPEV